MIKQLEYASVHSLNLSWLPEPHTKVAVVLTLHSLLSPACNQSFSMLCPIAQKLDWWCDNELVTAICPK